MAKIEENNFIQTNEQYGDGIAIDTYKDEYSLVAAKKNTKTGDIWASWGYPQIREDGENVPGKKCIPWKLNLGLREQAIQRLEQLIMLIEGRDMDLEEPF